MKLYKLKMNEDTFKFSSLNFTDELNLTEESKNSLVEYLNTIFEEITFKTDKDFISIISEGLNVDNQTRIGNTIDIYTTNKKIYQMCYLEDSKENLNFLGTVINNKRKIINGDVYVFANELTTTKIVDVSKTLEYIKHADINMDDLIEVILSNYYFKGLYFEGEKYGKYLFDNTLKVIAPEQYKGTDLSSLAFKKADVLNFSTNVFFDKEGNNLKKLYNNKLGFYYLEEFKNRIFFAIKSESEKNFDNVLDDYINKLFIVFEKFCFDDDEIRIPKEFKFYDYQSNEKYTNKYIVFDNLYDKLVLKC